MLENMKVRITPNTPRLMLGEILSKEVPCEKCGRDIDKYKIRNTKVIDRAEKVRDMLTGAYTITKITDPYRRQEFEIYSECECGKHIIGFIEYKENGQEKKVEVVKTNTLDKEWFEYIFKEFEEKNGLITIDLEDSRIKITDFIESEYTVVVKYIIEEREEKIPLFT